MAAKKSSKKSSKKTAKKPTKKTAKKTGKKAAKKAAKRAKKAPAKRTAGKAAKKAAPKAAKAVAKKTVAAKPAEQGASKGPEPTSIAPAESAPATERSGVAASAVNMGHVFSLRPRANTSFPQQALRDAKLALADQSYVTIAEAARAVAEKALEITNDGATPARRPGRSRF